MSGFAKNRIRHFVAGGPTTVIECLSTHFKLEPDRVSELLKLGAIYRDRKRVFTDEKLAKGDYLRIHLQPKRFALGSIDWKKTVVHDAKEFLVCFKPAGAPAHPTLDNQRENVLYQLRNATGYSLLVTQRLDVPVSGLMVIAKTPDFQRSFNQWLAERRITKHYRAIVGSAVAGKPVEIPAVGPQRHYMEPSDRSPRRVSAEMHEGWQICDLNILSQTKMAEDLFEFEIDLLTGRTHQIRVQLSALKVPVLGDKLYGSKRPNTFATGAREQIALSSCLVQWEDRGEIFRFEAPAPWNQKRD